MAKKETEPKVILEREYTIPLRREWLKVPKYKRTNKAVKAIRQFLVRHMKIYDRDLKKVKIDILLNNELRFRGIKKPPAKIKVKVKKLDDNTVRVELAEIPKVIQYKLDREKKKKVIEKKAKEKEKPKKPEEKPAEEEKEEKVKEKEEKKEAVREAGLKQAKAEAKQARHVATAAKQPTAHRKALEK